MNVRRTNPTIAGLGCMWCGGVGDDFDSPAYGYSAVQSARDQAGIDYTAMGMPSQTQLLAASTNGAVAPLTVPSLRGLGQAWPYRPSGGYPSAMNEPGSTARALTQTSPDYPTPTALTISQAFQGASPGDAQPGYVNLPALNWTANNLSFVKPVPTAAEACPATNFINSSNPLMLLGIAFALGYIASMPHARKRAAARKEK